MVQNCSFRALIVDDERLARQRLMSILRKFDSFTVVGEANDVPGAIEAIEKLEPDILFLDIQMPKQNGFDLLEITGYAGKIVFVTAYDNYALKAFDVNAADYLVKPVKEEKIERLKEKLTGEHRGDENNICCCRLGYDDVIYVSDGKRYRFVEIKEIRAVCSTGNYTTIVTSTEQVLVYKSLKEWEERLPRNRFCRIHRTTIVNICSVSKIEKWFNYSLRVYLQGIEQPFIMSKRFSAIVRKRFS